MSGNAEKEYVFPVMFFGHTVGKTSIKLLKVIPYNIQEVNL